jgi:hypothetical protein
MNFITPKLMGGLGNYLFQIAATYSKSIDDNLNFIIDQNDITVVHSDPNNYKNNIFRKLDFQSLKGDHSQYQEPSFNYNVIPKFNTNIKLVGYFQSEKYFINNRDKILDILSIDEITDNLLKTKYKQLLNQNTCSLHVRRGDYIRLNQFHPPQQIGYYEESVRLIGQDLHYLIFSDDINWCKENLSFIKNKTFIEGNEDFQDLYLMSMCKNNIIANSSFSWWGGWLNDNPNKIVIAPKNWFGPAQNLSTADIRPLTWIQI